MNFDSLMQMKTLDAPSQKNCAELLKAVADEIRLKILHSLFEEEKCVSRLMEELKLAQSHVSHHLKILKVAGLIHSWRDGHKICYALKPQIRKTLSESKQETLNLGCCKLEFNKS